MKKLLGLVCLVGLLFVLPFASARGTFISFGDVEKKFVERNGLKEVPGKINGVMPVKDGYKMKFVKDEPVATPKVYTYFMKDKCTKNQKIKLHFDVYNRLVGVDCNGVSERHEVAPFSVKQKNPQSKAVVGGLNKKSTPLIKEICEDVGTASC